MDTVVVGGMKTAAAWPAGPQATARVGESGGSARAADGGGGARPTVATPHNGIGHRERITVGWTSHTLLELEPPGVGALRPWVQTGSAPLPYDPGPCRVLGVLVIS